MGCFAKGGQIYRLDIDCLEIFLKILWLFNVTHKQKAFSDNIFAIWIGLNIGISIHNKDDATNFPKQRLYLQLHLQFEQISFGDKTTILSFHI